MKKVYRIETSSQTNKLVGGHANAVHEKFDW